MINCLCCGKETKNPKFCSQVCSGKYNGKKSGENLLKGKCFFCGRSCSSSLKFCSRECREKNIFSSLVKASNSRNCTKIKDMTVFPPNKCAWHCCNNLVTGIHTKFCSIKCKNKYHVKLNRINMRKKAVEYLGGKCSICGYNKCMASLDFHHKDPSKKNFGLSRQGATRTWEKMKAELDKCILLCSNCHGEIHFQDFYLIDKKDIVNK